VLGKFERDIISRVNIMWISVYKRPLCCHRLQQNNPSSTEC